MFYSLQMRIKERAEGVQENKDAFQHVSNSGENFHNRALEQNIAALTTKLDFRKKNEYSPEFINSEGTISWVNIILLVRHKE